MAGHFWILCAKGLNYANEKSIVICFKGAFLYSFVLCSVAVAHCEHETNFSATSLYQHTIVDKGVEFSQLQNK